MDNSFLAIFVCIHKKAAAKVNRNALMQISGEMFV